MRVEDDRTVILLGTSFLDDLLKRLIATFLVEGKPASMLLEGFNAPLGTFSSRMKAAQALGLVTDVQYGDLEQLREIRNRVAHRWEKLDLTTPEIVDRVRTLSDNRLPNNPGDKPKDLPDRLRGCVSCTIVELETMVLQLSAGKRGHRLTNIGLHLYPGPVIEVPRKGSSVRPLLPEG